MVRAVIDLGEPLEGTQHAWQNPASPPTPMLKGRRTALKPSSLKRRMTFTKSAVYANSLFQSGTQNVPGHAARSRWHMLFHLSPIDNAVGPWKMPSTIVPQVVSKPK